MKTKISKEDLLNMAKNIPPMPGMYCEIYVKDGKVSKVEAQPNGIDESYTIIIEKMNRPDEPEPIPIPDGIIDKIVADERKRLFE
jgi:hypothetical protein